MMYVTCGFAVWQFSGTLLVASQDMVIIGVSLTRCTGLISVGKNLSSRG